MSITRFMVGNEKKLGRRALMLHSLGFLGWIQGRIDDGDIRTMEMLDFTSEELALMINEGVGPCDSELLFMVQVALVILWVKWAFSP